MRNVIFAINITLDRCCDHTKQIADEETREYFTNLMRDVDPRFHGLHRDGATAFLVFQQTCGDTGVIREPGGVRGSLETERH